VQVQAERGLGWAFGRKGKQKERECECAVPSWRNSISDAAMHSVIHQVTQWRVQA